MIRASGTAPGVKGIKQSRLILIAAMFALAWGVLAVFEVFGRGDIVTDEMRMAWLGLLPGFGYLAFCFGAWLKKPSYNSKLLAIAGIGCSLVFLTGPVFHSQPVSAIFSLARSALVLAGFAAMLHFLFSYPQPARFLNNARNASLLYLPAIAFWLLLLFRSFLPPSTSDAFDIFTYVITGLVTAFYMLSGIIVFLRRYIRASDDERNTYGLRLILWGTLLGFLPAGLSFVPPFSALPGAGYYILTLVLPPAAWSLAVLRAA